MWQLASTDGRSWVRYEAGRASASADLQVAVAQAGQPVEVAANTGMIYEPYGAGDPVGVFLHARNALGWPQKLTGTPPAGIPVPPPAPTGPGGPTP